MAQPSTRQGMGAIPYAGGTAFRVWAPDVPAVFVAGEFNGWSDNASPLAHEGGGYWSADVAGAGPPQQYRFVIALPGGRVQWRVDPYAREVTSSVGDGIIVEPSFDWGQHPYRTPAWNDTVIYQLHTGTFNDYEPFDGRPAMFENVLQALPYLRDLGVSVIQILPASEFPQDHSWGYNPTHMFAVERAYGGLSALKRLIRAAHEHDIGVIVDVVYNHCGPFDLEHSLWRFNGWSENDGGGIYFYNDWRRWTEWGDRHRPDYGRREVRDFLRDNALYWLEECRADGLRFDATAYIRMVGPLGGDLPDGWTLMQWINSEVDRRQGWKLTIAEDMRGEAAITRPVGEQGAGFDSQWDADFVHTVRRVLTQASDDTRDIAPIVQAIRHGFGDALRRVIYTESHDEVAMKNGKVRVPVEIDPAHPGGYFAKKRSTLGAALVMTAPGIPMIFQGQEFHEDVQFHDTHPLDWRKVRWFSGIVALYRDLIALRRNRRDTTRGLQGAHVSVHHQNPNGKVVGFHRWANGGPRDDVVVLMNFSNATLFDYRFGVPRPGAWRVRFNSDAKAYSPDFGDTPTFDTVSEPVPYDGMEQSATIGIGPYTSVILSQE